MKLCQNFQLNENTRLPSTPANHYKKTTKLYNSANNLTCWALTHHPIYILFIKKKRKEKEKSFIWLTPPLVHVSIYTHSLLNFPSINNFGCWNKHIPWRLKLQRNMKIKGRCAKTILASMWVLEYCCLQQRSFR